MLNRRNDEGPRYIAPLDPYYIDPRAARLSPDGKKLVYARGIDDIYLLDLNTLDEERITSTHGNARYPSWSPDGRFIVYERPFIEYGAPDSTIGVFSIDMETGSEKQIRIHGEPLRATNVHWISSKRLAYQFGGFAAIYTVDLDADRPRRLLLQFDGGSLEILGLTPLGDGLLLEKQFENCAGRPWQTTAVRLDAGIEVGWPVELRPHDLPSAVSRNGKYLVYTDLDSTGRFGVLFMRETSDATGATARQLTTFDSLESR